MTWNQDAAIHRTARSRTTASSARRVLIIVARIAFGLVGLVLALGAALGATVAAARSSTTPSVFLGAGVAVLAAGSALTGWLVAGRSVSRARRNTVAGATATVITAIVGLSLVLPTDGAIEPAPVPGMTVTELRTGSRIAWVRLPATPPSRGEPIVVLHGGPGVADMAGDLRFFGQLVEDGRDVILYDQVGAGHSGRLQDPGRYSLERDVADLNALLDHLAVERAILAGHSYGGTLAAAFLAAHPDRVARVAFLAPGEIRPHDVQYGTGLVNRLDGARRLQLYATLLQPRSLLGWLLSQVNPRAAYAFAGDTDMDARFDRIHELGQPGLFCRRPAGTHVLSGLGSYTNAIRRQVPDLRDALARVEVPVLIVKPQCDYLPWVFATDIAMAMPGADLVYLRGAGHSLHVERPGQVLATLRAFLADAPLPVAPVTDLTPPGDLDGPVG